MCLICNVKKRECDVIKLRYCRYLLEHVLYCSKDDWVNLSFRLYNKWIDMHAFGKIFCFVLFTCLFCFVCLFVCFFVFVFLSLFIYLFLFCFVAYIFFIYIVQLFDQNSILLTLIQILVLKFITCTMYTCALGYEKKQEWWWRDFHILHKFRV